MRFSVIVPVLSAHNTEIAPNVSMADILLVRTFCFDKRQAPKAGNMVKMTGNSSGNNDIASAKVFYEKSFFGRNADNWLSIRKHGKWLMVQNLDGLKIKVPGSGFLDAVACFAGQAASKSADDNIVRYIQIEDGKARFATQ